MIIPLKDSRVLESGQEFSTEYVPQVGENISVIQFIADAAFINLAYVQAVWKYGQQGETIVWSITGSGRMPWKYTINPSEIDGVNKFALVLKNSTLQQVSLSGIVLLENNL